jgi:predicted dehydrogenase/threonine dehydrogenase-like Zn-dependent dehydrogenase
MKQVIQNFKTGELYVDDVPLPSLSEGIVLIENQYSLISAGTERSTVKVAQANLLNKARQRPDLVAQVIQNIKKEGIGATISKVRAKLDSLKALGYSTSGVVITSMDTKGMFKPGDRVACAGLDYASHAEIIAVPQNLVVKIPGEVSSEEAAFTTLGAIAIQGLRQAEARIGEKICVIGLGLLGQITCQLLRANGCSVFGIDLSESLVFIANKYSSDKAILRNDSNLITACDNFTNGRRFDTIIITAATQSNDPVELAGELARKKGKVVIVGVVPMDLPRDPHYYKKELDVRMSCSYGPGRYDVEYEETGQDYPYAFVRWTEQRNMESFLDLLARKRINLAPLTTHVIDINEAEKAYDIILGKVKEPHIGILLKYSKNELKSRSVIKILDKPLSVINTGFIGAGSFAQSYLIPNVRSSGCSLDGVVTSRGITAKNVGDKFGFNFCSSDVNDILGKENINTVFIATPHSSHADLVIRALKSRKNIFVEKPLAINIEELSLIIETRKNYPQSLMVGFNRRFAAVSERIKKEFANTGEPLMINIRVNAGFIPKDNWLQQKDVGAGRIIGEMCHFIDLMQYFTESDPVKVYAECISSTNEKITPADNIAIVIKFSDGSVGNLTYLANGDKSMPKELIEVFSASKIGVINDFKDGHIYRDGKIIKLKSSGKGHREEIGAFINALKSGNQSPISFRSICLTTLTTFKIHDALYSGMPQNISLEED